MSPRRSRRGNYATLLAPLLLVMLGFTAVAVDAVNLVGSRAEARSVADAAAHAALAELRRTSGNPSAARSRAEQVLSRNTVAGQAPELEAFAVGTWDDQVPSPAFDGSTPRNAVELRVRQPAVRVWFRGLAGTTSAPVGSRAVAASRGLHLVVVVDLDPAWTEAEMSEVRTGLAELLGRLSATAAPADRVALVASHSRFAWVLAPLAPTSASAGLAGSLGPASRAGLNVDPQDGVDCAPHAGGALDDFAIPTVDGCFPSMPRAYSDEDGTDLALALDRAAALLADPGLTPPAERAVLVVSRDGIDAVGASAGSARAADGFLEARFPEATSPAGQAELDLIDAAATSAGQLWTDLRAHLWVVAAGGGPELTGLPRGAGTLSEEVDAAALGDRLPELVSALPMAVVQ